MEKLEMTSQFVMKVCKSKGYVDMNPVSGSYIDLDYEVNGKVESWIDSAETLFPDISKFDQWEEVEVTITIKRIEGNGNAV